MGLLDIGTLNCFYFFLLMIGLFYAIFVLVAGGLHAIHLPHIGLPDLHLGGDIHLPHGGEIAGAHLDTGGAGGGGGDLSGHDIHLLSLSPISLATFVTSFGAIGIITTQAFGASAGTSLVWAVVGSVIFAIGSHFLFFYFFIAPQASSAVRTGATIGLTAEVTVPIPADSVGEIAYVAMGERYTATARSADHTDIPRGATVSIQGVVGTVTIVKPKE
ncbi:MAG: NfeD family protein [Anaerolineae bacterium]